MKSDSLNDSHRILILFCLIIVFNFSFIFSCQNIQKKEDFSFNQNGPEPQPPNGYQPQVPHQITFEGENWSGKFSPKGNHILFLKKSSSKHLHSQIYEMNRNGQEQRRITFHDGDDLNPTYNPSGDWILYTSNTDEIKEKPKYIELTLANLDGNPMTESNHQSSSDRQPQSSPLMLQDSGDLYYSTRMGNQITRITFEEGFDGQGVYHPSLPLIAFVSHKNNFSQINMINTDGSGMRIVGNKKYFEHSPSFSPDGKKLALIRKNVSDNSEVLIVLDLKSREEKQISKDHRIAQNPQWHPSKNIIIFSSNTDNSSNYELFTANLDTNCIERITYSNAIELDPTFSPEGETILFSNNQTQKHQLYLMDYRSPGHCENDVNLSSNMMN